MGQTLENLVRHIRERLQPITRSPEQASAEANLLIENLLGYSPSDVYMVGYKPISASQCLAIDDLLYQRIEKRIPIQYLLHQAWFYGLPFYVNPHVLIPRPETELLVEAVLNITRPGLRILEIGTGPGAIAFALAHKLGDSAIIVATDISKDALRVARINQRTLGTVVDLRAGDLFGPIASEERFDVIVSNPPYIDQALRPVLDAEVASHEPEIALFSPTADPCYYYRRLSAEAKAHLNPGGQLMVEMGAGMAEEVRAIFQAEDYRNIRIIPDYAGIERMLLADIA